MASSIECPKCGHANTDGSSDCDNCGITFDIFETEKEKARHEKEEAQKAAAAAAEEAKYKVHCLKCGHMNSPITDDCIKCGVIFAKCYESTEQELAGDPEKAGELAELLELKKRHKDLKTELLEKQKEAAARKKQEEKERLEALRREREKQEALRKEREEKERLEAEKKAAEEKNRQEKLRKEKEEKERLEAEKKAAEEEKRQIELEKEQERLKIEQEKQKKEQDKQRKEQEEKERAAALKELEEEKKRQAENERLEAEKREREGQEQQEAIRLEKLNQLLKPKTDLKKLLKPYIGESVGMNYDIPTVVKTVKLLSVNEDYISVHGEDDQTVYSYPLRNILSIAENIDGITTGGPKNKVSFPLIIKVSHRMV